MTALVLLAGLSFAAEHAVSAGAQGVFGAGQDAGKGGVGHEVTLERRLSERWLVEGLSTSAASQEGARFTLMAGGRYYLSEPWTHTGALSVYAAGGLDLFGPSLALALGGSVDLPSRHRLRARVSAGLEGSFTGGDQHGVARMALAVLVPPPRKEATPPPPPPPPEPPPPEKQPLDLEVLPAEAMVWVPHPVCAWVPSTQVEALIAGLQEEGGLSLSAEATLELMAEGYVPAHVHPEGPQHVQLRQAPAQGSLLVLAYPGDQVAVDGHPVTVSEDGVALVNAPEGRVRVEVRAGGQRQEYKAALANGYAVWVRVRPPPPTQILFTQGRSELSAASLAQIQEMAASAAGWSFVLQGAYSYEGSLNVNHRLARERGLNVGKALQDAGIPPERIAYLDPPPADPNRDPTTQRACNVIAVPPERTP